MGVFSKYIRYSKVGEGRVREFLISEIATIITHGVGIKLAQLIKIQQGFPANCVLLKFRLVSLAWPWL